MLKETRSSVQVNFFSFKGGFGLAQSPCGPPECLGSDDEKEVVASPGLNVAGQSVYGKSPGVLET